MHPEMYLALHRTVERDRDERLRRASASAAAVAPAGARVMAAPRAAAGRLPVAAASACCALA